MKKNLRILGVLVLVVLFAVTAGGCGGKKEASPGKVLQLTLDGPSTRQAELQAVSLYLKQVGIDAQVRVWEKNALEAEVIIGSRQ
ncbi:MAG: ABC transporter substrate-binding protein, partial [Desulfocucumaceae bacterium]